MNTAKGVAGAVSKSPRALGSTALGVGGLVTLLYGIITSEAVIDEIIFIVLLLVLAFIVYFQHDWALAAVESFERDVVWRIPVRQRLAALTIDDVPLLQRPSSFEGILDVLRDNKVTATLFIMSGFNLSEELGGMEPGARERCMKLLKRAVEEGHELGNHLQFDRPAVAMPEAEFDAAFEHCDALLAELSGGEAAWRSRPRRWFRPASAIWNGHILDVAKRRGYTTVISNCYPHDVASASRFLNATYLGRRARPGAIIIVHDRWHTPATLAKALPEIARKGLRLATLSELQAAADAEKAQDAAEKRKSD